MMVVEHLEAFVCGEFQMHACFVVKTDSGCMLISPDVGTTLCLTLAAYETLVERKPSENLMFVLVQRAFAAYRESRAVSEYSEQIRPEFFLIDLTRNCNLNCSYCFRDFDQESSRISAENIHAICDALIQYWKQNPTLFLKIQGWGGEPLLELPMLLAIRSHFDAVKLHPEIMIETNATLLTADTTRKLLDADIHVGISIDGIAEVQNEQRPFVGGNPSSSAVEAGIACLRKAGFKGFGTITVVTNQTLTHFEQIFRYFVEDLHLRSIKLNLMRQTKANRLLALNDDEIVLFVEKLLDRMHFYWERGISIVEQNLSQHMQNLLFRPNQNICNACGCHGGYRMLSIDAEGRVYPCELSDYPDLSVGTVQDFDFAGMVHEAKQAGNRYFGERVQIECTECPWQYYCRGGCRSAALYSTGNPCAIDHTECRYNKVLYPKLAEIILNEPSFSHFLINGEV